MVGTFETFQDVDAWYQTVEWIIQQPILKDEQQKKYYAQGLLLDTIRLSDGGYRVDQNIPPYVTFIAGDNNYTIFKNDVFDLLDRIQYNTIRYLEYGWVGINNHENAMILKLAGYEILKISDLFDVFESAKK